MLAETIGHELRSRRLTLSTAESCTGGMVGAAITSVSGSSDYYLGGVISYSNDAKMSLLSVEKGALDSYGAVSREVAMQMCQGCRARFSSDIAVSTTGIAGPGGGTPTKPVGLVYICVCSGDRCECSENHFRGDREEIRKQSVEAALQMVLGLLRAR